MATQSPLLQTARRPRASAHLRVPPVAAYFAAAFLLSWGWWLPLAWLGETVERGSVSPSHVPGLLGPMLAAFLVSARTQGRTGVRGLVRRMARWRVGWRWWLVALSPLAFLAVAAPAARVVDGTWPDWSAFDRMNGFPPVGVVGVWALVVLLNGFGEETGWRGYAIPQLQRHLAPLPATLVLAAFWGIWHAPLFGLVGSFGVFELGTLVGFSFGLACGAVVLTWVVNRTDSVLMVALWHGTYNIVSGSAGADGTVAAVVTTLVMTQAIVLVVLEIRARRRGRPGVLAPAVDP